jgi:pimeloyl-ACP methyl ester carboxylesterase
VGRAEDRRVTLELVRFEATDGLRLAGLLYTPLRRTRRAVVFIHGTGGASVYESKRTNILGTELTARGFAFFAFNNRGAHIVTRAGGMTHERIRDCVFDIDGALRELRRRGFDDITLAGHSTGANKVALYDHLRPRNRVKRYVLLGGGDDTGLLYQQLGARRFHAALSKAREMIHAHRGDELVPKSVSPMILSWRAFYDMANPNGDYNVFPFMEATTGPRLSRKPLFRHVRGIRKPALYLYGTRDEYIVDFNAAMKILAANIGRNGRIVVLDAADHGFSGREGELVCAIVAFSRS